MGRVRHDRSSRQDRDGDSGRITVELAQLADDQGSALYRYHVTDSELGVDYEAADLRVGSQRPDAEKAASALLSLRVTRPRRAHLDEVVEA